MDIYENNNIFVKKKKKTRMLENYYVVFTHHLIKTWVKKLQNIQLYIYTLMVPFI